MMELPVGFPERIRQIFGAKGSAWLDRLPFIIARCRDQWNLEQCTPCATMSISYIEYAALSSGRPVVLKVCVPHPEFFTQMEVLQFYNGRKAVFPLQTDNHLAALLMPRLQPGTMLSDLLCNKTETEIAGSLMGDLPLPVPAVHTLPSYDQWLHRAFYLTRTLWDLSQRMPRKMIDLAETVFQLILRASPENVVLHGDLHHGNMILDQELGWTAIDPKGVIGPRCMEVGRFLHNRLPTNVPLAARILLVNERVETLYDSTSYPPELIIACGYVDFVLSYCWRLEDDGVEDDWGERIALGSALGEMVREHLQKLSGMIPV